MSSVLKAALVQISCGPHMAENKNRLETAIRSAAAKAELIVLPELHNSVYFCQTEAPDVFDLAEPIPGPSTQWLGGLAQELDVVIIGSLFERRAAGIYHNTAVVLDRDGTLAGSYRKMHIPDDPGYYEKFYFTPGDQGFQPIECSIGQLGVLVCWDQWYPEAARLMALAGADLLIYPTAIGWDERDTAAERSRQRDAWMISQRAHAVANGIPVLSCNRVGTETDPSGESPGIRFWGTSFVCGPQGELIAEANPDQPETLVAEIDLARSETVRRIWPFFRDRRIDAYGELIRRYRD